MPIIARDDFKQEDSGTLGSPWQVISGGFRVKDEKAEAIQGVSYNIAVIDSGVSDCGVSVDIESTGNDARLHYRVADVNNFYQLAIKVDGTTRFTKMEAGSSKTLGSKNIPYVPGMTLEAILSGENMIIKLGGVEQFNVNDAFNSTMTKHGIGSSFTGTRHDNFVIYTDDPMPGDPPVKKGSTSKQFEFADFVDEFRVDFVYTPPAVGVYKAGRWVEGLPADPESVAGIILPFNEDELNRMDNGVYTSKDRKVYTTRELAEGGTIVYKSVTYTVERMKDYSDYADVFIYMAKGAGKVDRK